MLTTIYIYWFWYSQNLSFIVLSCKPLFLWFLINFFCYLQRALRLKWSLKISYFLNWQISIGLRFESICKRFTNLSQCYQQNYQQISLVHFVRIMILWEPSLVFLGKSRYPVCAANVFFCFAVACNFADMKGKRSIIFSLRDKKGEILHIVSPLLL